MKKISRWASHHKWTARMIIISSFIILNALAILTGVLLSSLGFSIPLPFLLLFAGLYGAGFIAYPVRNGKPAPGFYTRQKSCDFLLAGSTFLMIICLANHPGELFRYGQPLRAATSSPLSFPGDSSIKSYKSIAAFSASVRDEKGKFLKWKERKKLLKEQVRAIKKDTNLSDGSKTLLIILSVIVALALLYLVAALACSLSCGGSDALAVIVGVGGAALVIWLLIYVIRSILGKTKKKIKDPETVPEPVIK